MPRRDIFHDSIIAALEAEDWTITHDPFIIPVGKTKVFIDLAAEKERIIAAQRGVEKIAVEVKTFTGLLQISKMRSANIFFICLALRKKTQEGICIWDYQTNCWKISWKNRIFVKSLNDTRSKY